VVERVDIRKRRNNGMAKINASTEHEKFKKAEIAISYPAVVVTPESD
jgi:hypothetical protein